MPYPVEDRSVTVGSTAPGRLLELGDKTILPILICANTQQDAQRLEDAVKELLSEYGFDVSAVLSRKEFPGSWFIKIEVGHKSKDAETDLELDLGSQTSDKKISPEKHRAIKKLKDVLEAVNGWVAVGVLCLMTIAGARELVKEYPKAFPPETTSTMVLAAQDTAKIRVFRLPTTIMPALENAEREPARVKMLIGSILAGQVQAADEGGKNPFPPLPKPGKP